MVLKAKVTGVAMKVVVVTKKILKNGMKMLKISFKMWLLMNPYQSLSNTNRRHHVVLKVTQHIGAVQNVLSIFQGALERKQTTPALIETCGLHAITAVIACMQRCLEKLPPKLSMRHWLQSTGSIIVACYSLNILMLWDILPLIQCIICFGGLQRMFSSSGLRRTYYQRKTSKL